MFSHDKFSHEIQIQSLFHYKKTTTTTTYSSSLYIHTYTLYIIHDTLQNSNTLYAGKKIYIYTNEK